jgi:hypothetical protein
MTQNSAQCDGLDQLIPVAGHGNLMSASVLHGDKLVYQNLEGIIAPLTGSVYLPVLVFIIRSPNEQLHRPHQKSKEYVGPSPIDVDIMVNDWNELRFGSLLSRGWDGLTKKMRVYRNEDGLSVGQ